MCHDWKCLGNDSHSAKQKQKRKENEKENHMKIKSIQWQFDKCYWTEINGHYQ